MAHDNRSVLEVLKFELNFVEQGGYHGSPHSPRRPPLVFQDSPSCMNFGENGRPFPCERCLLIDFVPAPKRTCDAPCRHIPVNSAGQTIDDLYRKGNHLQLQETIAGWLRAAIAKLEQEEVGDQRAQNGEPVVFA